MNGNTLFFIDMTDIIGYFPGTDNFVSRTLSNVINMVNIHVVTVFVFNILE